MRTLCADSLTIERSGKRVLDTVSAQLQPGKITAICGPNGAGKSSLLMALAGLLPSVEGRVQLGAETLSALSAQTRARAVGYLPQGADIAWDVAAESLVALGRHPYGDGSGPQGSAAVERALVATGLDTLRKRRVSQLSGGERARVLLARVLAGTPEWILADEPLAALDLAHQLRMIGHLRSCADNGQGVVIVLHDLALAMNHADRVLVLKEGAVLADGPAEEVLVPKVIEAGWDVSASWLGEAGRRALVPDIRKN